MATPYFDFMVDANGTAIHNHTANSGQAYSTNAGFKIQDNRLYCDDISNNLVEVQSGFTTDATFKADLNFRKVTDAGNMGITFGDSGSGFANGYLLRVNAGQQLRLWSLNPLTDKGIYNFSIADGQDFKVTIDASPGNIDIYLDDVLRLDPLVSPNSAAGKLFFRSNVVFSSTTGYHLDSIAVYEDTPPYPKATYTVDVDGTDSGYLQYHDADSGQTYGPTNSFRLGSDRAYFEGASTTFVPVESAICDVEYDIDANFYKHTDAGSFGVLFGSDATLQTGFYVQATTSERIQLWEIVSGSPNFRNSYTHGTADGNPIPVVHIEVRSGQIEVFVGGVSRFTHINAANKEGQMYFRGASAVTATTGNHLSDVTYTAITNGAGGPLVYNDTFTQDTLGVGSGTLEITDTVTVPTGAVTITGFAPSTFVTDNTTVAVPAGFVSIVGFAPSVEIVANDVTVDVPAGAVSITGFAPTVVAEANVWVDVPAGSVSLTGYAPSIAITADRNITVPTGSVTITGYAPTITGVPINIEVPTGAVTLTGYAPIVVTGFTEPKHNMLLIAENRIMRVK